MGHIGMPQSMHSNIVGQSDGLADLLVGLPGAAAASAAKGECGGAADVLMLPLNLGVLFLNPQFGRLLFRAEVLVLPPAVPPPYAAR